jgi:DNA polymerase-3 subunit epsilon
MREVIFDTETTGLDPQGGDRLVEIGCIEMVNRVETGRTFHCYFNPERAMAAAAEEVQQFLCFLGKQRLVGDAFLADKPLFAEKAEELLAFLGDAPLVAHNASFDFGFVNMELGRCGLEPLGRERMVDTVALARVRHPGAKNSLDALCTRYGIDRSHRTKHGALLDAELLCQVYVELTGGRQIGLELAAESSETLVASVTMVAAARTYREPRPHSADAAELAAHATFLETIEAPLWRGPT